MKFSCDRCGRAYSVSEALAGRSFHMRCRACGHVISVRGASNGGRIPSEDEPLGSATSISTGPRPADVPPRARDENPFETQPISIAAVRAALDAQERKRAQEAGRPSTGLAGFEDLLLGKESPGPGSQPVSTRPPLPRGSTEEASAGASGEQQPAEDPFAGWDADDGPVPSPAPPEPAPAAEVRPAARPAAESRAPPTDRTAKRGSSRLLPVLAALAAIAVTVVLLLALCAP